MNILWLCEPPTCRRPPEPHRCVRSRRCHGAHRLAHTDPHCTVRLFVWFCAEFTSSVLIPTNARCARTRGVRRIRKAPPAPCIILHNPPEANAVTRDQPCDGDWCPDRWLMARRREHTRVTAVGYRPVTPACMRHCQHISHWCMRAALGGVHRSAAGTHHSAGYWYASAEAVAGSLNRSACASA